MSFSGMLSMTNDESSRIRYRACSVRTALRRCHERSVTHTRKGRQLLCGSDRATNAKLAFDTRVRTLHPHATTCSMRHLLQNITLELLLAIWNACEDACHRHDWKMPEGRRQRVVQTASSSMIRSVLSARAAAMAHSAHGPATDRPATQCLRSA